MTIFSGRVEFLRPKQLFLALLRAYTDIREQIGGFSDRQLAPIPAPSTATLKESQLTSSSRYPFCCHEGVSTFYDARKSGLLRWSMKVAPFVPLRRSATSFGMTNRDPLFGHPATQNPQGSCNSKSGLVVEPLGLAKLSWSAWMRQGERAPATPEVMRFQTRMSLLLVCLVRQYEVR